MPMVRSVGKLVMEFLQLIPKLSKVMDLHAVAKESLHNGKWLKIPLNWCHYNVNEGIQDSESCFYTVENLISFPSH